MSIELGRQVRIFVPSDQNHLWSDRLITRVIKPIVECWNPQWFWFTRYHAENEYDSNDCDWSKIPRAYKKYLDDYSYTTRSMRFRFRPKNQQKTEDQIAKLCSGVEGWFSDFRDYSPVSDLGSMTMLHMCESACRVVMENLDENGRMTKSSFHNLEQMHHRVCNIAHITDYRKLGINLVKHVMWDYDNLRYDSPTRTPMWDHQ